MADEIGCSPEEIDLRNDREPLKGLMEAGTIVLNPVTLGKRRVQQFRAGGLDKLTLADLMLHAESCVDPSHKQRPGRVKTLEGPREVESISARQFRRIKTAANKLTKYIAPAAARRGLKGPSLWACVHDSSLWVQDEGASGPSEWTRARDLMQKASGSAADLGAIDLLLDLAATDGLIQRTSPQERYVLPVAWVPVQERWLQATEKRGLRGRQYGLAQVLRAAADVLGPDAELDLRDHATAERVVDHLRDRLLATSDTSATQRTWIRGILRRLMDAGEIAQVTIDRFDQRQYDRFKAWSQAHDKLIAAAHSSWSPEMMDEAWSGFPFHRLADAENPYSLRRAVEFMTCPQFQRADWRGLPLGMPNEFPRRAPRNADRNARLWSEATSRKNLTTLAYFFGVLARYTDLDLTKIDLRTAFCRKHLELVLQARDDGRLTTYMAREISIYVGFLASPYLESMAIEENDIELADRMSALSALASGRGAISDRSATGYVGQSYSAMLREERKTEKASGPTLMEGDPDDEDEGNIETQRKRAQHIQRAFEAATGEEWAYDGMVIAYEAARSRVLRRMGVESARELHERWDEIGPNSARRQELRALALWNDCLAAPMRTRAIHEQTLAMRRWKGGSLILNTPGSIHKWPENGRYRLTLWEPGSGYDIDMWLLWEEYVRPEMLNGHESSLVWVNDMTQHAAKLPEISKPREQLKKVARLAAAEMDFDVYLLRGAVAVHPFRHAVASKLVSQERSVLAATLLHHASTDMVMKVYGDLGSAASTGSLRSQSREKAASAAEDAELLARIKANPELMRQLLENADEEAA